MRKIHLISSALAAVLIFAPQILAYENLTELENRKSRKSSNTFYSGENPSNHYMRQPQSVLYRDTSTNHEVWLWTQTNNKATLGPRWSGTEYNWQPWSADGKRILFYQDLDVGCFYRTGHPWFVARTDGSYWRPIPGSASRASTRRFYPDWSPSIPDVAYVTGSTYDGNSGRDQNGVYREVFTDTSVSSTMIVDLIPGNTSTHRHGGLKDRLTGDGLYLVEGNYLEDEPYYIVQIEPAGSRRLVTSWDLPALDTYWYQTENPTDGHAHDEGVSGNAAHGYWFYFMPTGSQGVWWRLRLWGTDGGPPNHTEDHTSPYSWWEGTAEQTEIQIPGNEYGHNGNAPSFTYDELWSHSSFDRHGTYVLYSDVEHGPTSPGAMEIESWTQTSVNTGPGGCQYHSWTGWSDYFVSSVDDVTGNATAMGATLYNSNSASDHVLVAESHSSINGDFTNPGQSPDGTKMVMRSDWLNASETADLFVGVVYYPYPPEITACSASGGSVAVRFDWRLDQAHPRGYTTRGWPHQDSDDPPPPRETELFRLWRSQDQATWEPVATTSADIFSRYNFATGNWTGSSHWELTDAPGSGTWYYAVTSKEWSGLESVRLSNKYRITVSGGSGSGSQTGSYPGELVSGVTSCNFYSNAPSAPVSLAATHRKSPATAVGQYTLDITIPQIGISLVRYVNVYAKDGSAPSADQSQRVASLSVNLFSSGSYSYVDWLGKTDGSTQYGVTIVDTLGNESPITLVGGGGDTTPPDAPTDVQATPVT